MLCLILVCQNSIQPVFKTSSADASFVKPSLLQLVMIHIFIADVTCNYYFSHLCVSLTFFVFFIIEHCLSISLNIILSFRSLDQFLPPESLPSIYYASAFSQWGASWGGAWQGDCYTNKIFVFFNSSFPWYNLYFFFFCPSYFGIMVRLLIWV